jgi:hypothetical protein
MDPDDFSHPVAAATTPAATKPLAIRIPIMRALLFSLL